MKGPKNGIIKASFKDCSASDRKIFPISHGMLLISVGQSYHEAQKLYSTVDLVNKKFAKCTILVCDTLQRYNMLIEQADITMEDAYTKALFLGDAWLERNESIYNQFSIPYAIKRWDNWLKNPEFDNKKRIILNLYENDQEYREAILCSLNEYIYRREKSNPNIILNNAFIHCLNYLIEECAAMLLWVNEGYNFEIYPCKRNTAMAMTYQRLIQPFSSTLLKPVALRFKRYAREFELDNFAESDVYLIEDEVTDYV